MLREHRGETLGVRSVRIAWEHAVQIEHVERRTARIRFHRQRIADRNDAQRADEVRHRRSLEKQVDRPRAPGSLVAMNARGHGDDGFALAHRSDAKVERACRGADRKREVAPRDTASQVGWAHCVLPSSGRSTQRCSRCERATALMISWTFALCAKLPWFSSPPSTISCMKLCTRFG